MSNNLVVVAIPAADDQIWKISSEKIPHLTLLFLGEVGNNPNIDRIFQFVSHAVNICEHGPFYVDVDRRETLGVDQADVLHFRNNRSFKWLNEFRNQLLQNSDIRTLYDSTEQFPEWQPHLTLGYPATPAHEDKIPDYGINGIRFDRIVVWTGNYEGPEFRLEWPEREGDLAVAYSETGAAAVEELLHFGTKGMKWGVRNASKKVANTVTDNSFKRRANSTKNIEKLVTVAADRTKKNDLPAINAKYKGVAKTSKNPSLIGVSRVPAQKAYRNEVRKAYEKNLNNVASETTSKTGKLQYQISESRIRGKKNATAWRVKTVQAKHADMSLEEYDILLVEDDDGYIVDFKNQPVEVDLIQTASLGEEYILEHFGTKGMKWGVRNTSRSTSMPAAVDPVATSKVRAGVKRKTKIDTEGGENHPASDDAIKVAQAKTKLKKSGPAALSNKELQEVANRVELEARVSRAVQPKGRKFVSNILKTQGNQQANTYVNKRVKKQFA